jgi:hypothetical protein
MGIGVEVEIPASEYEYRLDSDVVAAWISPEAPFPDNGPEFLISVFWGDRPGVMARVLHVLDDGVARPGSGALSSASSNTIRFSIDGSLSSSIAGVFVLAFIARPTQEANLAVSANASEICSLLKRTVAQALNEVEGTNEFPAKVEVFTIRPLDRKIFFSRRFTEYRFGMQIASEAVTSHNDLLGQLTARFTRELGSYGAPIAYLYFPDKWDDEEGARWLRVGVGAPSRAVDSLTLDLIANGLAKAHGCLYKIYDPGLPGPSMGDRFRKIEDYRPVRGALQPVKASPSAAVIGDTEAHVDVVFAEGSARPGYVGDMLAGLPSDQLRGGSMTVIAGHTISCWVVKQGLGPRLEGHIRRQNDRFGDADARVFFESVRTRHRTVAQPEVSVVNSFWLAWSCPDDPGILRKIVDRLRAFVRKIAGEAPVDIDVKYGISRVLADNRGCAGKVNFSLTSDSVVSKLAGSLSDLEQEVHNLLHQELRDVYALHPRWSPPAVLMSTSEPGEEPWASLVIGAPIGRGLPMNVPTVHPAPHHRRYRLIWLALVLLAAAWTVSAIAIKQATVVLLGSVALLACGVIALIPVLADIRQRRGRHSDERRRRRR